MYHGWRFSRDLKPSKTSSLISHHPLRSFFTNPEWYFYHHILAYHFPSRRVTFLPPNPSSLDVVGPTTILAPNRPLDSFAGRLIPKNMEGPSQICKAEQETTQDCPPQACPQYPQCPQNPPIGQPTSSNQRPSTTQHSNTSVNPLRPKTPANHPALPRTDKH